MELALKRCKCRRKGCEAASEIDKEPNKGKQLKMELGVSIGLRLELKV